MRLVIASALAAVTALAPATASAAERWAGPNAARTTGPCLSVDPCTLAVALGGAAPNDEVLLLAGRYEQPAPLTAPVRVTLRGAEEARPVIAGSETSDDHAVLTFRTGGTLRHVEIQATQGQQEALVLQGGSAQDVVAAAVGGSGIRVYGAPNGTLLRDTLVRTAADDGDRAAVRIKDGGNGDARLRNVTALAPAGNAIRCELTDGGASIVNTIARGLLKDIKGSSGNHCLTRTSNFRRAYTSNLVPGAGDQQAEPQLDADGRPLVGSPTIDAGSADAFVSAIDPAGCARGDTPDIGAFELCAPVAPPPVEVEDPVEAAPTPTPSPTPTPTPPPVAPVAAQSAPAPDADAELPPGVEPPAQGASMVVAPAQGKVLIRQPGTNRFVELAAGAQVPVGSEIDASKGRVTLVTAVAGGLQDGTFWGGRFTVSQRQAGDGMTSLTLKGGSFKGCPTRPRASAAAASKKKPVRKLWAKDKNGRFRTHGHNSVATARGTNWLTEDTCAGTRTKVVEGAVEVRDKRSKRTTLVKAGRAYLAPRR